MDEKEKEFLKRLRETFRIEAEEHLRALSAALLELEKAPDGKNRAGLVEAAFREAHSLKGAARSVSLSEIESVCRELENAFSLLKRGETVCSGQLCDLFHQALNQLARLVAGMGAAQDADSRAGLNDLLRRLAGAVRGETVLPAQVPVPAEQPPAVDAVAEIPAAPVCSPAAPAAEEKKAGAETVRIPAARLAPLLLQAEELLLASFTAGHGVSGLRDLCSSIALWKEAEERRGGLRASGTVVAADEAAAEKSGLNSIAERAAAALRAAEQGQRELKRIVEAHLEAMKQVMLLPVSSLTEGFPKLVRDLAGEQGKEADLVIKGADLEMDKRILDELKTPLIHLLRNCMDHGVQKPAERERRSQPRRATVTLSFQSREGGMAEVVVSDDGAGLNPDKVRAAAVKAGAITAEAAEGLGLPETLDLIFESGISTSPIITDISGRGLGLAIVREKVGRLGGAVSAGARPGGGAEFRLSLPLTMATVRGVLVRAGGQLLVLPSANVERAVRVRREEIKTVENRETIKLAGEIIATVRLDSALGLAAAGAAPAGPVSMVVLASGDKRIAFQVDEILEEHPVLVRGLGAQLQRVRNISGATILGSGKAAPVLNAADLIKSAARAARSAVNSAAGEAQVKTARILVADDSITARTLIKNILETAGYKVTTAVDGADAYAKARSGEFDLLVSDVDMPRLSGFELTSRIRGDKKLAELPVVLVTALESREDRERGIEAGADAYIVKSSFDQSNLLETVRRLI